MDRTDFDIIVIGGSSGSIGVVTEMLDSLPAEFSIPVIIVLHRLKNVSSKLSELLSTKRKVKEPEDKEPLRQGYIYLAPQNFHLLVENDHTFSMDYSELVNYSRPSIDVTFMSVADVYRERTLAILLSGANKDGAEGMATVLDRGGYCIAQHPATAECATMPEAAIERSSMVDIQDPITIIDTIYKLSTRSV